MTITKLDTCKCPTCQIKLNAASAVDINNDQGPQPEDVTVCAYCGEALAFDDNLHVHKIDINTLPEDVRDELAIAMMYVRAGMTLH